MMIIAGVFTYLAFTGTIAVLIGTLFNYVDDRWVEGESWTITGIAVVFICSWLITAMIIPFVIFA